MSKIDTIAVIRWGAVAGLLTCIVYPLMIFVSLSSLATVVLASSMGPLFGVASWGLREFVDLDRPRPVATLGAMFNALAGALLTAMLLVQLAAGIRSGDRPTPEVISVWLGLDVAWDVYGGLGTLCFAVCALRHPRLGRVIGGAGIAVAVGLLALNLYTFPTPPGEAGLVDLGPAVGLWYLVVTVVVFTSLSWARDAATRRERA